MLDTARAVQGLGAAVLFATSLALLAEAFPEWAERSKALAIYGATIGASFAVGPAVGGAITSYLGWRWVFYVNVPVGIATIAATYRWVRESRDPNARRVDWPGQAAVGGGLLLLVLGLLRGNEDGWGSPVILAELAAAGLLLAAFVAIESRVKEPMLPLEPLPEQGVRRGAGRGVLDLRVVLRDLPLHHAVPPEDPGPVADRGGACVPALHGTDLLRVGGERVSAREGLRRCPDRLRPRFVAIGLSLGLLATATSSWWMLVPSLMIGGLGTGLFNPAGAAVALGSVPPEQSGLASGVNDTFRQAGIAVGVALFGALIPASAALGDGSAESFVSGMHTAFIVAAVLAAIGAVASARLIAVRRTGAKAGQLPDSSALAQAA